MDGPGYVAAAVNRDAASGAAPVPSEIAGVVVLDVQRGPAGVLADGQTLIGSQSALIGQVVVVDVVVAAVQVIVQRVGGQGVVHLVPYHVLNKHLWQNIFISF